MAGNEPVMCQPLCCQFLIDDTPLNYGQSKLSSVENPGWLFDIGDYVTTQLYRDYFINHDIRIPVFNQPGFHGMSFTGFHHCSIASLPVVSAFGL